MDAAQLRKIALYLAVALLLAGAASAQTLVVSPTTVTFSQFVNSVPINVTSTGADFQFTIGAHSGWYSPAQGTILTTPATINVTRNFGNCQQLGTCNDSFEIIHNGVESDKVTVNVSVDVNATPGSTLTASPSPLSIPVSFGGSSTQLLTITTTSATAFGVTITQTPTAGSWLFLSQTSGTVISGTPLTLSVTALGAGFGNNQTLSGTITVTPTSGTAINIPVNMIIGSGSVTGSLIPNPTSVALAYPTGNTGQSVQVTSNIGTANFNASANSTNGWLLVNGGYSVNSIPTGSTIVVSLNSSAAALLGTGTFNGTISLTNTLNAGDVTQIPVTITVNGGTGGTTSGSAAPSSLNFVYEQFRGAPPCQQVLVPYTGTFTVTPSGSPLFLYTSGAEFTAPGTVLVCAAVAGLGPGVYQNALNIVSTAIGISQSISVNLNVYANPIITASANSQNATNNGAITCFFQTGVRGCNDAQLNVAMSDGSAAGFTATSSATWVTFDTATGTTPGTITVHLNPANLSNGVNTATITVTGGGANGSVVIPVVVQVNGGTSGGTGNLTFSASSLSFTAATPQTLSVTAASAMSFTASVPSTGCSWLTISPSGALTTPQNISVSVNATGLNPGTPVNCNISFVAGGMTQTVGVSFTPPAGPTGNVTVDKTSLTFTTTTGTNPPTQTIAVSSVTGPVGFTTTAQSSGWLSVTPASATTPFTLNVNVNASGLATGAHAGQIFITPNGGQTVSISVALTVSPPTTVSATPTALSFSYIAGSPNPAAQQISVTGTGSNLGFTAAVTTGSEWLSVTPASGTAPASLDVRVNPGSLNPGSYTGTITVAGSGGATGSTTTTVTLTVTAPLPTINRVTNAASFNTGPISAGEIITLFGIAMGPGTIQTASPSAGVFPTTLGGVQVTVGGYPAPLIYVRGDQIAAVVPYEINRPFIASPTVVVRYLGQSSNGVTLTQVGAAPGIFTTGGGTGQGAILNSNLSVNSAANPANKGDVIVLYLTGEGVTDPASVTGRITPSTAPFPVPATGAVTVTIDGQPATVVFRGAAPGLIAGVLQANVMIPLSASSGSVPVVVRIGDAASQLTASGIGAVTVAVR